MTQQIEQLPLSGRYHCETCFEAVPIDQSVKSRERYDQHTLCFRHQLQYKKQQVKARLMKREAAAAQQ